MSETKHFNYVHYFEDNRKSTNSFFTTTQENANLARKVKKKVKSKKYSSIKRTLQKFLTKIDNESKDIIIKYNRQFE